MNVFTNAAQYYHEGIQRIELGEGVSRSLAGMTIVFSALIGISVFVAILPKILNLLSLILPTPESKAAVDDDNIAVVIGVALHHEIFESDNQEDN